ncbi:hypothetical protein K7X08_030919 [Anisodus acutangulus]|uniref:Uncharacterized protein n=1 Tax=Anisodus acutangulus TaxID=402998 RepID=A0A9Q1M0K9_9SOLA|nr:hypothetical protein K7X08_030919 [Anisodus acutangulus]
MCVGKKIKQRLRKHAKTHLQFPYNNQRENHAKTHLQFPGRLVAYPEVDEVKDIVDGKGTHPTILISREKSDGLGVHENESTRRTCSQVKPVVKPVKTGKRKVENDNENVKKKRKVLALVEKKDSYFGYFLDFPPFKNQNQLIYALLLKKIAPGCDKEIWIELNGYTLSVQCILNWQVKEGPTFVDLASGKLMTSIYQLKYQNITPTSEENSRLNIAAFSEDVNVDDVPLEDAPTFHNDHSNVVPPVHPQNIEQQPRPRFSTFASLEDLKAEIMRLDVEKFTGKVTLLNDYVVSSFKRLFKLFDPKVTKEKGDDVPVSENHQSVDNDAAYDHDGYQHFDDHNFTADVPEGNMTTDEIKSNVKANEGVTDGISGAADATANDSKNWYNDELTDEVLTKHCILRIRIKFPGRWNQSPFVVKFGSDISSTSKSAPKRIFEEKYPFVNNIDEFDPYSLVGRAFSQFIEDGMDSSQSAKELYPDGKNDLPEPFIFGSIYVREKVWFHKIAYGGQLLSDEHIDVIFYYLRKKGKYDPNVVLRFMTTD